MQLGSLFGLWFSPSVSLSFSLSLSDSRSAILTPHPPTAETLPHLRSSTAIDVVELQPIANLKRFCSCFYYDRFGISTKNCRRFTTMLTTKILMQRSLASKSVRNLLRLKHAFYLHLGLGGCLLRCQIEVLSIRNFNYL